MDNKYMVFVRCMTYNHSTYITDAMTGFCMQQTNFPFVCAIIDDASIDGEQDVISKFFLENFDIEDHSITRIEETDDFKLLFSRHKLNKNCYFAVILLKYNHYRKKSKLPYYKEWEYNSKYVALCEGDDYWIAPHKLQIQVDFMEKNSSYSMCYHPVFLEENGIRSSNDKRFEDDTDISVEQLILNGGGFCATCSLLYRQMYYRVIPHYTRISSVGDWPLQIHMGIKGKVRYISDIMAIYRRNVPGSWTERIWNKDLSIPFQNNIEWLMALNIETGRKYEVVILEKIIRYARYLFDKNKLSSNELSKLLRHFKIKNLIIVCGMKTALFAYIPTCYYNYKKINSLVKHS